MYKNNGSLFIWSVTTNIGQETYIGNHHLSDTVDLYGIS